jgi:hypothetical protein
MCQRYVINLKLPYGNLRPIDFAFVLVVVFLVVIPQRS